MVELTNVTVPSSAPGSTLGTHLVMSGLLVSRPAAGIAGRLYYGTDTALIYRDDGATWIAITTSGSSLPTGIIVMWSGLLANIPSGWILCDGAGGSPDLRDRFVVGAAAGVNPGATGGSNTHTHAGHAAHVVTQPSGHVAHVVTQPADHLDVLNHVHRENRNSATTGGLDGWAAGDVSTNTPLLTGYSTANPTTGGVAAQVHAGAGVDAHSAHGGAAVDAHSAHASPDSRPPFYAMAYIYKT